MQQQWLLQKEYREQEATNQKHRLKKTIWLVRQIQDSINGIGKEI
jgi:hypothetical protein